MQDPMDFRSLNELRLRLEALLAIASDSLEEYSVESGGFAHIKTKVVENRFSTASTATVVSFLVKTGRWHDSSRPWFGTQTDLAQSFVASEWNSSDLGPGNAFTTAFSLDAIQNLLAVGAELSEEAVSIVDGKRGELAQKLADTPGLRVQAETPTAFVTFKGLAALKGTLEDDTTVEKIRSSQSEWVWTHLLDESVALSSGRPEADVFELGYSVLCETAITDSLRLTPRRRDAIAWAMRQFFDAQTDKGLWPRSQPLFHYPKYGDAYSYDYEFLTELLMQPALEEQLLEHLPALAKAVDALEARRIPLNNSGAVGWSSGHLKETFSEPESWSTASAFHFCHALHRLVIEAIRRAVFKYVGSPYSRIAPREGVALIPDSFLDSTIIDASGASFGLRETLETSLLGPLVAGASAVERGGDLPTPRAAILYGPPGTSKTQLAEIIARQLGWPLVKIDPSHLTRDGYDRVHAETNRLFTMLEATEQLVVLLDEFDELVRDRDGSEGEPQARFLTTAMLPKLTALYDKKKIVYLLATNHVERFDPAIARQGRFDMVVPVLPPSLDEKLRGLTNSSTRPVIEQALKDTDTGFDRRKTVHLMTFGEFREFTRAVSKYLDSGDTQKLIQSNVGSYIDAASSTITMLAAGDGVETWDKRLESQRHRIRIPS